MASFAVDRAPPSRSPGRAARSPPRRGNKAASPSPVTASVTPGPASCHPSPALGEPLRVTASSVAAGSSGELARSKTSEPADQAAPHGPPSSVSEHDGSERAFGTGAHDRSCGWSISRAVESTSYGRVVARAAPTTRRSCHRRSGPLRISARVGGRSKSSASTSVMKPGIISSTPPTRTRARRRSPPGRRAARGYRGRQPPPGRAPLRAKRPAPQRPAGDQQQQRVEHPDRLGHLDRHEHSASGQSSSSRNAMIQAYCASGEASGRSARRRRASRGGRLREAGEGPSSTFTPGRRCSPTSSISVRICGWAPRSSGRPPAGSQTPREHRQVEHQRGDRRIRARSGRRSHPTARGWRGSARAAGTPEWSGPHPRGSAESLACHRSRRCVANLPKSAAPVQGASRIS